MSAGPEFYHHKFNDKAGYQRQDGEAVRARSKAAYLLDPAKAKSINKAWYAANPEKQREYCPEESSEEPCEVTQARTSELQETTNARVVGKACRVQPRVATQE